MSNMNERSISHGMLTWSEDLCNAYMDNPIRNTAALIAIATFTVVGIQEWPEARFFPRIAIALRSLTPIGVFVWYAKEAGDYLRSQT